MKLDGLHHRLSLYAVWLMCWDIQSIVNDVTAKLLLRMHRGEQNLHEDIEFEAKKMAEQLEDARRLVAQLTECLKHRP